jgi:hypothetical protein
MMFLGASRWPPQIVIRYVAEGIGMDEHTEAPPRRRPQRPTTNGVPAAAFAVMSAVPLIGVFVAGLFTPPGNAGAVGSAAIIVPLILASSCLSPLALAACVGYLAWSKGRSNPALVGTLISAATVGFCIWLWRH